MHPRQCRGLTSCRALESLNPAHRVWQEQGTGRMPVDPKIGIVSAARGSRSQNFLPVEFFVFI